MLITCLMPTFNRYPTRSNLVEEAVYAFLAQDYKDKELLICNDTPGQSLVFNDPRVKIHNLSERFPTLAEKIQWMIEQAQGEYMCRWDDDDLSLPWRLSYSMEQLIKTVVEKPGTRYKIVDSPALREPLRYAMEWRPENHWFDNGGVLKETIHPGNTHIMSIWHRYILGAGPGYKSYPGEPCPSGLEDQTFNSAIRKLGYPWHGDVIPKPDIFYLYRWGVSPTHLSGKGGGDRMQQTYQEIGSNQIAKQTFTIRPKWYQDYVARAKAAADTPTPQPTPANTTAPA